MMIEDLNNNNNDYNDNNKIFVYIFILVWFQIVDFIRIISKLN